MKHNNSMARAFIISLASTMIAGLIGVRALHGQEPVYKNFISVEGAAVQIFTSENAGAEPVVDFSASGRGGDTLEIIKNVEKSYQVKYFSTSGSINTGWLAKGKGQKTFTAGPLYVLSSRYVRRVNIPSNEDRLALVLSHPDWNAVSRFAIADGYAVSGMTPEMVTSCFGEADERVRYYSSLIRADQWVYFLSEEKDFRLTFENGRLLLFEDRALVSSKEAKEEFAFQKQEYYYPYRSLSVKILLGGAVAMIAGYNGLKRQRIFGTNDPFRVEGDPLMESNNNLGNWLMVGVGFAAQALGGILFNYSPDAEMIIKKMTAKPGALPMIGFGIPIKLGKK